MPVLLECQACGRQYSRPPSRGASQYCSLSCSATAQIARAAGRTRERFRAKVREGAGCWEWQGRLNNTGYGFFFTGSLRTGDRRNVLAHRYSWELTNGPIPEGQWVLHKCDNPPCVNPAHLFLGSHEDNVADMVAKGRQSRRERRPLARLTQAAADEIRRGYAAGGVTQRELAARYGVSESAIQLTLKNKAWRVEVAA